MNYPSGEDNVYTTYQGDGGVKVGGLFGRLLFALKFGTSKILLVRISHRIPRFFTTATLQSGSSDLHLS